MVQADVKVLRDVCRWLNQVLPSEQYRQTAGEETVRTGEPERAAGTHPAGAGRETPGLS